MRDLHDDGMCPPVKGVNMRRKQNACDSNGGVHAERVTANMHDLTYGLKDFFREVFLDKDDIDYERRFDVRSLPLLVVAMAAGWLYSRDGNGFYACVSAIFAVSYTVYFIVNRGVYIVRLFRGENIFGKRRVRCMKYRGAIHSSVAGGLAKALEKFVDNDTLYAYIGGYGVPLLGTATMIAYDASHWLWLALVGGVLCVVYALYWLIYAFVAAHRALIAVLADRDRRLEQAGYRMTVMRRDAKLASRTHDTVTGGLSYIAFIAQQQLEGKTLSDEERVAWKHIDDAAQRTMDNVYEVIDILGRDIDPANPVGGEGFDCESQEIQMPDVSSLERIIREHCDEGDSRLKTLGFVGTSEIQLDVADADDTGESVCADLIDECTSLIDELYTNISCHADTSQPYAVFVSSENGCLRITQVNAIACPRDAQSGYKKKVSGRGLAFHRRMLDAMSGSITTCEEGDTWTLHVVIPL